MSSFIERKTAGPARLAQTFILGEKLGVNRARDERLPDTRIRVVSDDPVMPSGPKGFYGMPCGGRRRSCFETAHLR